MRIKYNNWDDVPVGVPVIDADGSLVWIKSEFGDVIINSSGNYAKGGWIKDRQPKPHLFPLTSMVDGM
jgi:hypothetical protein